MTFELFEAVGAPFPFTNCRSVKDRPVLIVSSANFNLAHRDSILTMILSVGTDWQGDVAIHNRQEAGLNVPCKVCSKLFTRDGNLIVRKSRPAARGRDRSYGSTDSSKYDGKRPIARCLAVQDRAELSLE